VISVTPSYPKTNEPIEPNAAPGTKFGINARNFDPTAVDGVRVRKFDGAETWAYVD
jgi:hypothetical protein